MSVDKSNLIPMGEGTLFWSFQKDFGPYLRKLRKQRGMTLQEAAEQVNLSFTKLQKLETGGRVRRPSIALLQQLAHLYNRPQDEVFEKAGLVLEMPPDFYDRLNNKKAFAALMLHPELKPFKMTEDWLESFSERQRQQLIEYSLKLEDVLLKRKKPMLTDLMATRTREEGE